MILTLVVQKDQDNNMAVGVHIQMRLDFDNEVVHHLGNPKLALKY
jgi:hypothetical protein